MEHVVELNQGFLTCGEWRVARWRISCAISKVEPNIEALVQAKQMQKSH